MLGDDEFNICRSGTVPGVAPTVLPLVAASGTTKQPLGSRPLLCLANSIHYPEIFSKDKSLCYSNYFAYLQIAQLTL